ncbi:MAG TPA: tetratricopeptide repeat protein [Usitatibacter sp.]|nr:tetratricopeptide repeat protein [Usitatibacter sp.]
MSGSYDFEEQERIAELRAWWEDNRWYVIAAITAAVIAFIGYRGYAWWQQKAQADAAAAYSPVADAVTAGDKKKADEAAKVVIEKYPHSFFASQSALMLARDAFDANNLDEAARQLRWVIDHGAEVHRGLARTHAPCRRPPRPEEVRRSAEDARRQHRRGLRADGGGRARRHHVRAEPHGRGPRGLQDRRRQGRRP